MPTNILNFCQKHKIKTLPINLAVGNGKKTYLALMADLQMGEQTSR